MISRIIEFSVRQRFIVIIATVAVAIWGLWAVMKTPVDAIPDLSENQVIVFADWMGRSPQEIEDQVTYPLSVALRSLAGVKAVRSSSEFNFSMITIIFDDATDFYFARTRVQEKLGALTNLPEGVKPYLAPDATALGQIFWYTVEGDGYSLDQLRATQDFFVRYQLAVPGVAEVASVGGMVREYQVDVDPGKLRSLDLPLGAVFDAISRSNIAVGGKVFVQGGSEYLIRGTGWLSGVHDLENVVIAQRNDVPLTLRQVATVQLGPQFRRSVLEKNGREVTGGVVMMRYGGNPLEVTQAIKQRIAEISPSLPPGMRIVPFYDRTRLIEGAIHTLSGTLTEELIIAALAILLILWHVRSAIVVCLTLPLAVLIAFILMHTLGIPSNIMSLAGLAISIGILVDASVVMVENATHELKEKFGDSNVRGDTTEIVSSACRLVGKPIFFAVVIMLISFLPVFLLTGQEGKMFHPLAFTKTFAMVGVAVLAITFVPAIIPLLVKGHLRREEDNPIVRSFINIYKPLLGWVMKVPAVAVASSSVLLIAALGMMGLLGPGGNWPQVLGLVLLGVLMLVSLACCRRAWGKVLAFVLLAATATWAWHLPKVGREFMPPLDEGSLLDMPVTGPRVSVGQAADDLKVRDGVMREFPEVEQVVGKAGRAETPTDPAGLDMVETIVTLRPKDLWPKRKIRAADVATEAKDLVGVLTDQGYIKRDAIPADVADMIGAAALAAVTEYDRAARGLARQRQVEAAPELAKDLTAATLDDLLAHFRAKGLFHREPTAQERSELIEQLVKDHGLLLVELPRQEEMDALMTAAAKYLGEKGMVDNKPDALLPVAKPWRAVTEAVGEAFGRPRTTLFNDFFDRFNARLAKAWPARMKAVNWELEDRSAGALDAHLLSALRSAAQMRNLLTKDLSDEQLIALAQPRLADLAKRLFLWQPSIVEVKDELDRELQMPGWSNIWTKPIQNRVDMLATGVRTQVGVKVYGPRNEDLTETVTENGQTHTVVKEKGIQTIANEIKEAIETVPGHENVSADQITGRTYLEVHIDRDKAARYGVNVADIQEAVETAIGGRAVTTTVEGRQRFDVRVRYARDFWQTQEAIRKTLVTGRVAQSPSAVEGMMLIPISDVADIKVVTGPAVIKSENGMLRAYVQFNVSANDVVGFVEQAQRVVAEKVKLPAGFATEWTGQFEHQVRSNRTLAMILPVVVVLIFVILLVTFDSWRDALLIILAVPGALAGGVVFQGLFHFNFSVAVAVGYIACFGMATQTGVVMLVYLHQAIRARGGLAAIPSEAELTDIIIRGAVHRLRPKLMTEGVAIVGLMPMLWAHGVGAEVIKPMAAPVLGGLLVADEVIDLLIPVVFNWYQGRAWRRLRDAGELTPALAPGTQPVTA